MSPRTDTEQRPTPREERRREATDLDRRYGAIGISAVAAAARYGSAAGEPAYRPLRSERDSGGEAAA